MKRQTYLRDENLLTLLSLHDFIVPEIQREYVWGSDNNAEIILRPFLESIKNSAQIDEHCHYAHSLENAHVGFLYSYKPQYIRDVTERITDEYLIDGQQRFTSLFLLLLVRAIREDRLIDFNNLIRWEDGMIAFDYKVRQLTHIFIKDLIYHVQKDGKKVLDDIENHNYPYWLMNDYLCDTTVSNIINALKCIDEVFYNNTDKYYDYLLTRIHFWHFKTDVTSQGEELYITMNSRGEELADNEVQKARKLKNTDQKKWGSQWEEWQTFFWRNRNQGDARNFDADKGFNNLLACIYAMGARFGKNYSQIEDTQIAVKAFHYMVDTDWESILQRISTSYDTKWIQTFKNDVWSRINTTNAKWTIDKETDSVQRENAVLLWPLFYYYFCMKNETIDEMTFIRLMHLCYLNYHSRKTNYTFIKDFIEELCTTNNGMLSLSSMNHNIFLSAENKKLSDLVNKSQCPECLESLIWKIQDKPNFLDGKDVGGDTIIGFIESMQTLGVDLYSALKNLYDNYEVLFPSPNDKKTEVLLKRLLLHYKDSYNETFWKRMSPYYDRNYETSSWKRIVRHGAFIKFYEEISANYTKVIKLNDLNLLIVQKQRDFFSDSKNRDFISQKWNDRRIAILLDTMTDGDLWNVDVSRYPDLGFSDSIDSVEQPSFTFIGNTWVGNRICGKRNRWQKVTLPPSWEWKLQRKYPFYSFKF